MATLWFVFIGVAILGAWAMCSDDLKARNKRVLVFLTISLVFVASLYYSRDIPNGLPLDSLENGTRYSRLLPQQTISDDTILFLSKDNTRESGKYYRILSQKLRGPDLKVIAEIPEEFKVKEISAWLPDESPVAERTFKVWILTPQLPEVGEKRKG